MVEILCQNYFHTFTNGIWNQIPVPENKIAGISGRSDENRWFSYVLLPSVWSTTSRKIKFANTVRPAFIYTWQLLGLRPCFWCPMQSSMKNLGMHINGVIHECAAFFSRKSNSKLRLCNKITYPSTQLNMNVILLFVWRVDILVLPENSLLKIHSTWMHTDASF